MSKFLQAGADIAEGKSAQDQAERNAAIDRADAGVVHAETRARTLDIFRQGRQVAKQVRTQAASSGFAQEGTPLILQAEAMRAAEIESLEEQRIGLTEERRLLQSAVLNQKRGEVARRTSVFRAFGRFAKGIG